MGEPSYSLADWNGYARCHASVTSGPQWELFVEAAGWLQGEVLDCGCGTARLAPLLADREAVRSYTGVDLAPAMVAEARRCLDGLGRDSFRVECRAIETVSGRFDSAVSLHSHYAWQHPAQVLARIYRVLAEGGRFVLASPNRRLDMERLLREAARALYGHPDFPRFCEANRLLATHPGARFLPMDELLEQVRAAGFALIECHQRHYLGGVNFLVLEKGAATG